MIEKRQSVTAFAVGAVIALVTVACTHATGKEADATIAPTGGIGNRSADGTNGESSDASNRVQQGRASPDGSRIVCSGNVRNQIVVVGMATGEVSEIAQGRAAIWLDDHSLLVDACRRISVI